MENNLVFEYVLIPGFRRSSKLLYIEAENQIFKFKFNRNNVKYYYCYQSDCKMSVAVDFNSETLCRQIGNTKVHNHDPQNELYSKLQLLNSIKSECKTSSLKRAGVREIYDEQCKKFKESALLVQFGPIRRQLLNIRHECFPKAPICFADIVKIFQNENVSKEFAMWKYEPGKPFYNDTIITEEFSYTVFASPTICNKLKAISVSEPRKYIVDSTFNVVPVSKQFKQLLIFHIVHSDHAYPFIYVLMSHKSQAAYTHALQYVHSNILDLTPTSVVTDFEVSLRNSIQIVYPTVSMKGCWFHFTNALRRKASKIPGFIGQLNKDNQAKKLFNKFMVLPLLKSVDIKAAFEIIEAEAFSSQFFQQNMNGSIFKHFVVYFKRQWMKKERPENFSVHKEPTTTSSAAEAFHSQLRTKLPKRGNFYKFLNVLSDVDASKSIDFLKSIAGDTDLCKEKHKWFKNRTRFIHERLSQLHKKKITLTDILNQLSIKESRLFAESFLNEQQTDDSDSEDNDEEDVSEEVVHHTEQRDLMCVICCEKEREVLFIPCKHCKCCHDCFDQIKDRSMRSGVKLLCPICRAIVKDSMFINM